MVFILISILSLIGLLSYYIIFSQIKISSFIPSKSQFSKGVSIIICAKNEAENISTHFNSWITQEYPEFELIIVNDQSTDNTSQLLYDLAKKYSKVKIVEIAQAEFKQLKGKRHALYQGIQHAQYDYVLFTDADCIPVSKFWVQSICNAFVDKSTEIVLGYSPYKIENNFLNLLIQHETLQTALQYIGMSAIGKAYMSVGRNVAYKKALLSKTIFEKSNTSISGDDDLIMQQICNEHNTAYTIQAESIVKSIPAKNFKEWIQQKNRHLSAGISYNIKTKLYLAIYLMSNIVFTIAIVCSFFINIKLFIAIFVSKLLLIYFLINSNPLIQSRSIFQTIRFFAIDLIYWLFFIMFVLRLNSPKT